MDHMDFVHNEQRIYIVWIFYLSCHRLPEREEEQTAQHCHLKSYLCKVFKILFNFSASRYFPCLLYCYFTELPEAVLNYPV